MLDLAHLAEIARQALAGQHSLVVEQNVAPSIGRAPATIPSRRIVIGVPVAIAHGEPPVAAVAVEIDQPGKGDAELLTRRLEFGSGWIAAVMGQTLLTKARQDAARVATLLDLVALAGEHDHIGSAALAVANELAATLECMRVSFGTVHGTTPRLLALSHSSAFDRRSQFAELIENAMVEAIHQKRMLVIPEHSVSGSGVVLAHRQLARQGGADTVVSVMLRGRGEAVGVLTAERGNDRVFQRGELRLLETLGATLGPVFELMQERDRWLAGRPRQLLRGAGRQLRRRDRPMIKIYCAMAVLAPIALLLIPAPFRISEKSVLEGQVQRVLVAPFDGFIREAPARAGDVVTEATVLARLDDRDLLLEQARWKGEVQTLRAKYADAFAQNDRSNVMILEAQLREADAQLALADSKLGKTRVIAPFAGVIVSGDLSQSLGSPVERGKSLFEIAPLDRFRVIVQVDERDMRYVRVGQHGRIMLAGLPSEIIPLTVTRTTPIATAEGGRNYFRVEASLDRPDPRLRPGMEGVARIDVGTSPLLWVWSRTLVDWLRLFFWKWQP
ncbi:HlyD family efflux transporter periplasmic adaptor subunit [Novosphingobium sp.]|uniref:HlyD family efflux transporter periplasmic adaptor subunit n=1 Tax=Novosphingobium sp. TaxID=1874826 RepID=UPI003B5283CA